MDALQRDDVLFWTYREAAEFCRLSIRKLQQLVKAGEVPFKKLGARVLFPVRLMHAWAAGHWHKGDPV